MSQRAGQLFDRIDAATDRLVSKFADIVALSGNLGDSEDNEGSGHSIDGINKPMTNALHLNKSTVAVESFNLETNSSTIVRAAEDLLLVTRTLKESWILGYIRPIDGDCDQDETESGPNEPSTSQKMDDLLAAILSEDN